MTNKEYRQAVEDAKLYTDNMYLTQDEVKELRADVRERTSEGMNATILAGSNHRASVRRNKYGCMVLTSYYTDVAAIEADWSFLKLWEGFSVTTLKHVNLFRAEHGLPPMTKRDWIEYPTTRKIYLW